MTRVVPIVFLIVAAALLLFGCSSNPANPEKEAAASAAPAANAKPHYDFGTAELSPSSGAAKEITFRVTIKRSSQKPVLIGLLINDRQNGGGACYAFRNLDTNDNSLVADTGSGAITLGQHKSVANLQCELLREGTGSSEDASGLTATFHIRFQQAFRGAKHIWAFPADGAGNGPEMQQVGEWIVQ